MAYCVIADVQALNAKRTYDATSTPTATQVESLITRIANEIDTVLAARGLDTPVTTPAAFLDHLKQVNAYGAAALAEMAMFPETSGLGETPHSAMLWKIYKEKLQALAEGQLPVAVTASYPPESFFTAHGDTEPVETAEWRVPKFGINKEF